MSTITTIHGAPVADICAYIANNRPCHLVKKLNDFQYILNYNGRDWNVYIYSLDTLKQYITFLVDNAGPNAPSDQDFMVCAMLTNLKSAAQKELFRELSAEFTIHFASIKAFQTYLSEDFWMAEPQHIADMQYIIHDMGRQHFIDFMYKWITTSGNNIMPYEIKASRKKSLKGIRYADAANNNNL